VKLLASFSPANFSQQFHVVAYEDCAAGVNTLASTPIPLTSLLGRRQYVIIGLPPRSCRRVDYTRHRSVSASMPSTSGPHLISHHKWCRKHKATWLLGLAGCVELVLVLEHTPTRRVPARLNMIFFSPARSEVRGFRWPSVNVRTCASTRCPAEASLSTSLRSRPGSSAGRPQRVPLFAVRPSAECFVSGSLLRVWITHGFPAARSRPSSSAARTTLGNRPSTWLRPTYSDTSRRLSLYTSSDCAAIASAHHHHVLHRKKGICPPYGSCCGG